MRLSLTLIAATVCLALLLATVPKPSRTAGGNSFAAAAAVAKAARLAIPASIVREHQELRDRLAEAAGAGGRTAEAARRVDAVLRPHLEKEERYALPPLGMLRAFSGGDVPANADDVLALTQEFRAEYPHMLAEHEAILAAVGDLLVAARAESHPEVARFATELMRHAESEEEVLYPTTVLIGEYLKLALAKDSPHRHAPN